MSFIQSIVHSFQHDGLFIQLAWVFTALIALFYVFVAILIVLNTIQNIQYEMRFKRDAKHRRELNKDVSYPIDPTRDGLY